MKSKCYLLAVVFLINLVTMSASSRRGERPRYLTAYACEGNELYISCQEGYLIHLIRANYGRFSISICNEHGNLDWSVDCMSHRSFRVMQQSCDMKKSCNLPASSSLFGDACPGTLKYLEAHYRCVPEATTASVRQPPPIIIPSAAVPTPSISPSTTPVTRRLTPTSTTTSTSTTTTTTTSATTHPHTLSSSAPSLEATSSSVVSTPESSIVIKIPVKWDNNFSVLPSTQESEIQPPTTQDLSRFCAPFNSHNVQWNWTKAGHLARQHCPGGATGEARWRCTKHVTWESNHPDLSNCKSLWVSSLEERIRRGDSVVSIAAELSMITRAKTLYGGDVFPTVAIVQQLVDQMGDRITEFPDDRQRHQVVKELVQSVIDINNSILDEFQSDAWHDLPHSEKWLAASALLKGLEQNALLLSDTQNQEGHFLRVHSNLLVAVHVLQMNSITDTRLPRLNDVSGTPWMKMEDSVFIPAQALLMNARNGLVKIVFLAYNKMDDLLDPSLYTDVYPDYDSKEEEWTEKQLVDSPQVINSRIVAAIIGRQHIVRLTEPILVTLKHIQEENVTNPRCVFWNFDRRDWSEQGCWIYSTNRSHTVCACSHLTNFAILMDISLSELSYKDDLALRVITYIGCIVSIVCLLLTILTFQFFRGLKSDRTTIHKNLCFCLLVAEAIFVAGIDQTHLRIVCGVVAGLLHYFFLAAFTWMFLEGFQLYVMLIEVFESEKSRIGWYYALAYGIPALIVGIAASVDPFSYGTERYCWLRADNYFVFSFVGPVIAVLLANTVFLGMAIYMMCRHTNLTSAVKSKEEAKLTSLKIWIRGAMVLVFLLGLTWAFGLLYLSEESVVMAYVFTILNSFQGLFIFIFHCIKNEKVQKEYHKFIHRTQWLPECIRHDKGGDRRSSFYVHSNGTVSAPHTSGQHSSHQNPWESQKKRNPSTSSSSLLRSSTQGPPCMAGQLKQAHDRKFSESTCRPGIPGSCPYSHGGITGDLSVADCSVVDSECVSEYCCDKTAPTLKQPQDPRQPPYGHLTGSNSPYMDHIYETIDDESVIHTPVRYPSLAHQRSVALEGHMRNHSDASHQSSSSLSCDQHPLIPPALPQRNGAIAHVLNSAPRHSSLPTERDLQRQQSPKMHSLQRNTNCGRAANSLSNLERSGSWSTLPAHLPTAYSDSNSRTVQPVGRVVWNYNVPHQAADSTVMMAVLDGERVVCKLQSEGNNSPSRGQQCYVSSHLSTDC